MGTRACEAGCLPLALPSHARAIDLLQRNEGRFVKRVD